MGRELLSGCGAGRGGLLGEQDVGGAFDVRAEGLDRVLGASGDGQFHEGTVLGLDIAAPFHPEEACVAPVIAR